MSDGIGVASAVAWPPEGPYQAPSQDAADDGKPHVWAQKGFQFHDLLDAINPLQHIPVISSIYRWITGEPIGNLPRVVGDALYGGPIGFVTGLLGVGVKEETGKDIGETVIAMLAGDSASAPANVADAAAPAKGAPAPDPASADTKAGIPSAGATAASAAPSSAPQVRPDHAPMPLLRGGAAPPVTQVSFSSAADPAAQAFLAQAAERQRQLYQASTTAPNGRTLTTQPVPLDLSPGVVSAGPRPRPVYGVIPAPAAAVANAASPPGSAPPGSSPIDISQRMMDALDKYMAIQRQQSGRTGAQVDVSP